jgi:hypothetical protein
MKSNRLETSVADRHSLAHFVRGLVEDLNEHPERWENADLGDYLEAMAAWLEDMDGYYANKGRSTPETPSWTLIAEILSAAKVYE